MEGFLEMELKFFERNKLPNLYTVVEMFLYALTA